MTLTGLKQFFPIVTYLGDLLAFSLAYIIASLFLFDGSFLYLSFFVLLFFILVFNYSSNGLYKNKRSLFGESELFSLFKSHVTMLFFAAFIILALKISFIDLYVLVFLVFFLSLILAPLQRFLLSRLLHFFRMIGYDRHRAFFFGSNESLQAIIKNDSSLGYVIKGSSDSFATLKKHLPHLDTVFVVQELISEPLMNLMITHTKITWKIIPSTLNLVIEPVDFDEFKDYPIINIPRIVNQHYGGFPKRSFDLIISLFSLVLLSPLFLLIGILIKITMPGPVFFTQTRLGKDLVPFKMFKFRSMIVKADELKHSLQDKNEVIGLFKIKNDPRVTRFGHFLRRTSLDELPQLFNVVLGHMSLVGPRPHLPSELNHFTRWRKLRFTVKPGLTGLWQIKGRHELNFDKAVLYDIYYARHMALPLDLEIIVRTIPALLLNKGRF